MRRLAIFLIVLGIGSFILPLMGRQFILVSVFEGHETLAGLGMIAAGVVIFGLDHVLSD
jgi:hypothetical protein